MAKKIGIIGTLILVLCISLFGFVHIVNAEGDSAGPTVSGVYPSPGSVININSPKFSIRFNDPAQLDSNVIVMIDGQSVSASVKWDDIYQQVEDSCTGELYDEYVGPDYTNGVVTAQFPQLSGGEHTVAYVLKDTAGNITENSYSFTISDTEGPQITQQNPADGATVATSKPTISAKISDTSTIVASSVYMLFNGSQVNSYYDGITAILSFTIHQPLKNGTYPVQVTASDSFGNTTVSSWSITVNDTTPPAITNLTPANGSLLGSTPGIAANISDSSGITNPVYLQVDSSNYEIQYSEQTGMASYAPSTQLVSGQHTVNMVVYDFQGNRGSVLWVFSVDPTGPVVSELYPAPGSAVASNNPQLKFRFNDPHQLETNVTVKIDGQSITPTIKWDDIYQLVQDSCTEEWYNEYVGPDYTKGVVTAQFPQLIDGQHTVYYQLTDRLGNVTENSYIFTISDEQGPEIIQQSPANGATVATAKPTISAKISDTSTIFASSVYMDFNGSRVNAYYDSISSIITYTLTQPVKNGTYPVKVTATDSFGNITVSSWSFTVSETTPPTITNFIPANGSQLASTTPEIAANISDASGIINPVYLQVDGSDFNIQYSVQTGKATYIPSSPLGLGQHTVNMVVYDFQGNKGSASWAFSIETAGPAVSELSPAPGSVVPSVSNGFRLRFNDSHQLDPNVIVKIDGLNVTATVTWDGIYQPVQDSCTEEWYDEYVGPDYTKGVITAPFPQVTGEQHSVYYKLTDRLGNITENTYSFTLSDKESPQIVSRYPDNVAVITTGKPALNIKLSDANTIVAESILVSLDGIIINHGYDVNSRTITYQVPQYLSKGLHTVQLRASDIMGNTTDASWSFSVNDSAGPQFSAFSPAANTVSSFQPVISAKVTDGTGVKAETVILTLNGEQFGSFDPNTGIVSYKPEIPLMGGQYIVTVSARDVYDNAAPTTWSFSVPNSGLAEITNVLPPNTSGTRNPKPEVSAMVNDPAGMDVSKLSISIDGVNLTTGFTPDSPGSIVSGKVYASPDTVLSNGMHTAIVTVFDRSGQKQVKSWQFGVNSFSEMPTGSLDCKSCHEVATIEVRHVPVQDCSRCHGSDCGECHGGHDASWPPPIGYMVCTQCHTSSYWILHGQPTEASPHNYSGLGQECGSCHNSSLTKEHNLYKVGNNSAYGCQTCHSSTNAVVIQAINSQNLACSACHGTAGSGHETIHTSGIDTACGNCHSTTLTSDHITSRPTLNLDCGTCHESTASNVESAVTDRELECAACHDQGHGNPFVRSVPQDIPLISGLKWSEPLAASIWVSETWMPAEFVGSGKVLLSSRSNQINGQSVWTFYKAEMAAKGWTQASADPTPGSNYFSVTFTKDAHKTVIWFYGGENHSASPVVSSGYRVEIIYE